MRLTQWTDYSLRVLMDCAACQNRPQPVTITEIAEQHDISRSHLTKIVHALATLKLLDTTRGRGGGLRLSRPPHLIKLGDVVRATETDFNMVECFDPAQNQCGISAHCGLKGVLHEATQSYLSVLDNITLADLVPSENTTISMPSSRRAQIPAVADRKSPSKAKLAQAKDVSLVGNR